MKLQIVGTENERLYSNDQPFSFPGFGVKYALIIDSQYSNESFCDILFRSQFESTF